MEHFSQRKSLADDFFKYAAIILLIVFFISCGGSYFTYQSIKESQQYQYVTEADRLSDALSSHLLFIQKLFEHLGEKIVRAGSTDAETVATILQERKLYDRLQTKDSMFSWALFGFVTPERKAIASSTTGVMKHPVSIPPERRQWLISAKQEPWKVHIDKPNFGAKTGEWVIPAGFGLTDHKGKFIGYLGLGFRVPNFTHALQKIAIHYDDTAFMLVDNDHTVVSYTGVSSSDAPANNAPPPVLEGLTLEAKDKARLSTPVHYKNMVFYYYKRVPSSPYILLVGESTYSLDETLKTKLFPQLIQNLILAALFVFLLFFFRRKIVGPMAALANVAETLAAREVNVTIPRGTTAETSTLSEALMGIRDLEKELIAANDESNKRTINLEKALNANKAFLSDMSAEMQAGVRTCKEHIQEVMTQWSMFSEQERFRKTEAALKATKNLERLIEDVFATKLLDNNTIKFTFHAGDVSVLVQTILEERLKEFEKRKITIHYQPPPANVATVLAFDRQWLSRVVWHLFDNVLMHCPSGSRMMVFFREEKQIAPDGLPAKGLAVSIQDGGPGIAEEEQDSLFEIFARSSLTEIPEKKKGVGLALCYLVLKSHQGKLWVENNPGSKGCTFTFMLPYDAAYRKPSVFSYILRNY